MSILSAIVILAGLCGVSESQNVLSCPSGHTMFRFRYNQPFEIHAFLNRVIVAPRAEECFDICGIDASCVVAIFEVDGARCVHGFINSSNLKYVCEEHSESPSFIRHKIGELQCSGRGCEAIEKICSRCDNLGQNKLIALTHCTGAERRTASQVCGSGQLPPESLTTFNIPTFESNEVADFAGDLHNLCCFWASQGECDSNPFWMRTQCQLSCGTFHCPLKNALSCEVRIAPGCELTEMVKKVAKIAPNRPRASAGCSDLNELCMFWAFEGECSNNVVYMSFHCPASCGAC